MYHVVTMASPVGELGQVFEHAFLEWKATNYDIQDAEPEAVGERKYKLCEATQPGSPASRSIQLLCSSAECIIRDH